MKAMISEILFWLLAICFCFLQIKSLLPHFHFDAADLEEFKNCGTSEVIGRLIGAAIATPVFLYLTWKTLDLQWRDQARLTAITQSKWIRHWFLLIVAIPGTTTAIYFIGQIISNRS